MQIDIRTYGSSNKNILKNVICCTYKIRFENFNQVISDGKKRYFEENIATMTFLTPAIYVTSEANTEFSCCTAYFEISLSHCHLYGQS